MNHVKLRKTAICPVCKRKITIIKHSGCLRRHNVKKGVLCAGAWMRP